ncbi:MAG: hypothetical protein KDK70_03965 [Myxococcales bacterium]|nr:hypothetical protein [Myxococcales bacterium]
MRSALEQACGHYVELTLRGGEKRPGLVVEVGSTLVLLVSISDFFVDGYEILSIGAIERVRRSVADEFYEHMAREAGLLGPDLVLPQLPLSSMRAALAALRERWSLLAVECGAESLDDDWQYLVGELVAVDDLRVQLRYVTTTGHWRELDVVPTRTITRVSFGSRYLEVFARHGRPWLDVPWAHELSAEQRQLWGPLSGILAALGQPVDGLLVRRLCCSFEIEPPEHWSGHAESHERGIELVAREDRIETIFLLSERVSGHALTAPLLEGLSLRSTRDDVLRTLGPPAQCLTWLDPRETRDTYELGPLQATFVFEPTGELHMILLELRPPST